MEETVSRHCKHKDCVYRSLVGDTPYCAYILATGQSRKCSISECDKYTTGEKRLISALGPLEVEYDI